MKTIEEASRSYADIPLNLVIDEEERYYRDIKQYEAFKAGVNFAQRWIPISEELPPCSDKDILLKGTDDRGVEGIVDVGYMHDSHDNKPYASNLIGLGGVLIKVTHWRYIDLE